MPLHLPPRPHAERLAPRGHWLVCQPMLDVLGECRRRRIAIARIGRPSPFERLHRARGDRSIDSARKDEVTVYHLAAKFFMVLSRERRAAGQQVIQSRAEAVDVARRTDQLGFRLGLLGTHVGERPQNRSGLAQAVSRPVDLRRRAQIPRRLRERPGLSPAPSQQAWSRRMVPASRCAV